MTTTLDIPSTEAIVDVAINEIADYAIVPPETLNSESIIASADIAQNEFLLVLYNIAHRLHISLSNQQQKAMTNVQKTIGAFALDLQALLANNA
jgi:hypothetical protein